MDKYCPVLVTSVSRGFLGGSADCLYLKAFLFAFLLVCKFMSLILASSNSVLKLIHKNCVPFGRTPGTHPPPCVVRNWSVFIVGVEGGVL